MSSEEVLGHDTGSAGATSVRTIERFVVPKPIEALWAPGADNDDPWLGPNGLELYFSSNRATADGTQIDLWVSHRAAVDAPWESPALVEVVNSGNSETTPSLSEDGLQLLFSSGRTGGLGGNDIWVSRRDSLSAPWQEPALMSEVNTSDNEVAPRLYLGGNLLLVSRWPGPEQTDVIAYERSNPSELFGEPQTLFGGPGRQAEALLTNGGLLALYVTEEGESFDIVMAERPTLNVAFGDAVLLDGVNSTADDSDPSLLASRGYLTFSSRRDTETRQIYHVYVDELVAPAD